MQRAHWNYGDRLLDARAAGMTVSVVKTDRPIRSVLDAIPFTCSVVGAASDLILPHRRRVRGTSGPFRIPNLSSPQSGDPVNDGASETVAKTSSVANSAASNASHGTVTIGRRLMGMTSQDQVDNPSGASLRRPTFEIAATFSRRALQQHAAHLGVGLDAAAGHADVAKEGGEAVRRDRLALGIAEGRRGRVGRAVEKQCASRGSVQRVFRTARPSGRRSRRASRR